MRVNPTRRLARVCLLMVAVVACGPDRDVPGRVLVIGIDGASPRVTGPWIEEGHLPNLRSLKREGAYGPLRSLALLISPAVWTSVATGKVPAKHGIRNFTHRVGGRKVPFQSTDRKVAALWNILSRARLSVAVINWWTTFPPDVVNGVVISDHARFRSRPQRQGGVSNEAAAPTAYPPVWVERISELWEQQDEISGLAKTLVGDFEVSMLRDLASQLELDEELLHARLSQGGIGTATAAVDAATTRIALEVERSLHPDVMLVLLLGIDRMSHFLWGGIESPSKRPTDATALRHYYQYTDALIGRLMAPYGPRDLVLVLSDHGFEAIHNRRKLPGGHKSKRARDGVLFARGPGIEPGAGIAGTRVLDITPAILAWLGLPVGADMDGQVPAFLQLRDVATVPTHDTAPIPRLGGDSSGSEEGMLEELRALGYIE